MGHRGGMSMLAFGRGLFSAVVLSTFILLLISFYPNEVHETFSLQPAKPTGTKNAQFESSNVEISKIKEICELHDIQITINKVILNSDRNLEIFYSYNNASNDYGLFDSYRLSQELFSTYRHLENIHYTVYSNSKPFIQASISKNDNRQQPVMVKHSMDVFSEIQKAFTITLLSN